MIQVGMWVEQLLGVAWDGADVAPDSLLPNWEVLGLLQSVELMCLKGWSVRLISMMMWLRVALLMALMA